jgi:hypothetical protein
MNTRTKSFYESQKGIALREELIRMTESESYNTNSTYSTLDPNGITFVEKHMKYMSLYPAMNCEQYVSNLKLKTKCS